MDTEKDFLVVIESFFFNMNASIAIMGMRDINISGNIITIMGKPALAQVIDVDRK